LGKDYVTTPRGFMCKKEVKEKTTHKK